MLVVVALGLLPALSRNSGPGSGTVFASCLERCRFCKSTWPDKSPIRGMTVRLVCTAPEVSVVTRPSGVQAA
jgi:hypothetical protein